MALSQETDEGDNASLLFTTFHKLKSWTSEMPPQVLLVLRLWFYFYLLLSNKGHWYLETVYIARCKIHVQ